MDARGALLLAAVSITAALPARAADPADPSDVPATPAEDRTELPPVTVTRPRNPLDAAQERARELGEDQPCLGCGSDQDAARKHPLGPLARLLASLTGLGLEPPNPDRDQRIRQRVENDWRVHEYGPEMEAYR